MRHKLEALDDLLPRLASPLDAEAEDAPEPLLEVPLGRLVVRVALQPGVRDPAHVLALLQVPGQRQRVLAVPLRPQAQRLQAEQELLRGEGVQAAPQVAQDLDARADDERDGAERVPELEPVVTLAGLDELGEAGAVLAPVELARVDHNAADGCAVAADPFSRRVDDNVGAVVDGADEVASRSEGVVDLQTVSPGL